MTTTIDDTREGTAELDWRASRPGHWRRDFRLGEWLTAPVTPSFASWFLPAQEQGFLDELAVRWPGSTMELPLHELVNGWYYTNSGRTKGMAAFILRHPVVTSRLFAGVATMTSRPERLERAQAEPSLASFDERLWPAHEQAVARGEAVAAGASPDELIGIVDELSRATGRLMMPMVEAAGFASKAEAALATFYDKHLRASLGGNHLPLLVGLVEPSPPPPHAVRNLDWVDPTVGEGSRIPAVGPADHEVLVQRREAAEARCREALARDRGRLDRFDLTLAVAQRWVPRRERLANALTSAWPVLRRALLRLGEGLVEVGVLDAPDDVFYCTRAEIVAAVHGDATRVDTQVAARRARRAQQAQLSPPLGVGKLSANFRMAEKLFPRYRSSDVAEVAASTLVGLPTSPGSASGPARVVRGVDDFERFAPGDVLVAPVTAPGWEPLLAMAAAVVTDGGSVFAHASVIAREYGIPCVVATGNATAVLTAGEIVTVDGDRGVVERAGSPAPTQNR